jgi:DNA-binding MarR family transcriptional regulator
MEAKTGAPERSEDLIEVAEADRELAYRLGAVLLRCLSGDGSTVVKTLDETGLTFQEMKAIVALAGEHTEPPTMKMLSERLGGLSLASTSRAIDGLVKRGLVLRVEDARDRRARRLSLTDQGRDIADRILAARLEGLGRFAATLSAPERRKLEAALDLLIQRDDIADVYRNYRKGVHR